MCDLSSFFEHALSPPGSGGRDALLAQQTDALNRQTALAQQSADAALAAQKQATAQATAASMPAIDSESARRAGQDRMRRLLLGSTGVDTGTSSLGAPPLGFRTLMGS